MKTSFLFSILITVIQLFSCKGKLFGRGELKELLSKQEIEKTQRKLTSDWTQVGNSIYGDAVGDRSGFSTALTEDGTRMVVGAYNATGTNSGSAKVYDLVNGQWQQVGSELTPGSASALVGYDVDISRDGSMIFVSAPLQSTWLLLQGQIFSYMWDGTDWQRAGIWFSLAGASQFEQHGYSVAVSTTGLSVVVGASSSIVNLTPTAGHIRIWNFVGGANGWQNTAAIVGESAGDFFGWDVAMNGAGNIVAVGAPQNDGTVAGSSSGHVRVYQLSGVNTWNQLGSDIDSIQDSWFGITVALSLSGLRVAAGGHLSANNGLQSGHVAVFDYDSSTTTWVQAGQDIYGAGVGDRSGWSVSISSDGNRLATSAPASSIDVAGRVDVYDYISPGLWVKAGPSLLGTGAASWFGYSLSLSGDGNKLAVGAPQEILVGPDTGKVNVYEFKSWFVYDTWAEIEGDNAFDGRVKIENEIGQNVGAGNVGVTLFDSGCKTAKPSTGLVVSLTPVAFTTSPHIYYVEVEQSLIGNATDFVVYTGNSNSTGTVEFCTRVSTYEGSIEVGYRETEMQLSFDMSMNSFSFSLLNVSIAENSPDVFSTTVDSAFTVGICQCDSNYICLSSAQPINQNDDLVVCLEPEGGSNSDVVEITNFNLLLEAGTVGTLQYYSYNPVQFGTASWSSDLITDVDVQPGTNRIKISTPIVAQFFIQGFTSVDVSGSANLQFVSSKEGRVDHFKFFRMEVGLDMGVAERGCLSNMLKTLRQLF